MDFSNPKPLIFLGNEGKSSRDGAAALRGAAAAPAVGGCRKTPAPPLLIRFSTSLPSPDICNTPEQPAEREKQPPQPAEEPFPCPFPLTNSTRSAGGGRPRHGAAGGSRGAQQIPGMLGAQELGQSQLGLLELQNSKAGMPEEGALRALGPKWQQRSAMGSRLQSLPNHLMIKRVIKVTIALVWPGLQTAAHRLIFQGWAIPSLPLHGGWWGKGKKKARQTSAVPCWERTQLQALIPFIWEYPRACFRGKQSGLCLGRAHNNPAANTAPRSQGPDRNVTHVGHTCGTHTHAHTHTCAGRAQLQSSLSPGRSWAAPGAGPAEQPGASHTEMEKSRQGRRPSLGKGGRETCGSMCCTAAGRGAGSQCQGTRLCTPRGIP